MLRSGYIFCIPLPSCDWRPTDAEARGKGRHGKHAGRTAASWSMIILAAMDGLEPPDLVTPQNLYADVLGIDRPSVL